MKKRLIVVTGQTATGKTSFAVKLAQKYNGELINCDSRQVYKYLDIVTGKDKYIIKKVPIWLYDIVDPKDFFSSYQYSKRALRVIEDVIKRGKTPVVVGGSYFYLKHMLYGIDEAGGADWSLRKKLDLKTVEELQEMLRSSDPQSLDSMNQSDRANPRRLMRRIEIARSKRQKKTQTKSLFTKYQTELIGFRFNTEKELRKQIKIRVRKRMKQGALEETRGLLKKGYFEKDPGLKTIGYKQLIRYLSGKINKEQAIESWITNEVQYAKRQLVFMKKDRNINWKNVD